jgi:TolB-like protein
MNSSPTKWDSNDQALINNCLDSVLFSPIFEKSHRQQDLLRFLVKETLTGNSQRLKGYTLGVEIFGRGTDFDPSVDAIVRVEVGRLRTKLREYYSLNDKPDAVLFDLPKGSYAINITFPDKNNTAAHLTAFTPKAWSNGFERDVSLAVLPFVNLSSSADQQYFVDGIVDNLIFELSRLSGLFIISRQSSFRYRDTLKSSKEIGTDLAVKYLLEGSIQLSDKRVRVTVKLIEANSEGYIWSERYESNLQEIFALQDEITLSIVKVLQVKLSPSEAELFGHEGTETIEAHDALLRGMACHWKYSPKSVAEAKIHFSKAVELDPKYASAHAWLSRTLLFLWVMKWSGDESLREQALMHAERAVFLNDRLPFALSMLGWAHLWFKHQELSIAACRQAVALDPNNFEAHMFLSMSLSSAGFGEEALYYIEKAQRINPHSSPFYEYTLGLAHYVLEDYEKAIIAFKRGCAMSETFPPNYVYLCTTYAMLGMEVEMNASRETFLSIMGGDKSKMIEPPWTNKELAATYEHLLQVARLR